MAFKFNGTDLKNIIYNGVSLGKVIFNGVTVWIKELFIFSEGNTSFSNGCTIKKFQSSGNSYYEYGDGLLKVVANGEGGSYCDARITTFDVSDFSKLEIIAKCNDPNNKRTLIQIYNATGTTMLKEIVADSNVTTSYKTFTADISGYTGKIVLHINSTIWTSDAWSVFYIKSIRVY